MLFACSGYCLITLSEARAYTDTLSFSTPITNPILDIVSLGAPGNPVSYLFSAAPTILSQGDAYWGTCGIPPCLTTSGNTLSGQEADGVVEFVGTFSTLSWTTTGGENWNGFTLAVAGEAVASTPEPAGSTYLFIAAAAMLPYLLRRRTRAAVSRPNQL